MKQEIKPVQSGADLLRIHAISPGDVLTTGDPSLFRILWLTKADDIPVDELHVLLPGSTWEVPCDQSWTGHCVCFREELLLMTRCQHIYPFQSEPVWGIVPHASIKLPESETGIAIKRLIISLSRESNYTNRIEDKVIPALFKILLVYLARLFEEPEHAHNECENVRLFKGFLRLISDNSAGRKNIQYYAKVLSVPATVLSQAVRKVSGYSASQHIQSQIIRVAKQAAIGSGVSMKEVAYTLGFRDTAHFSKFFRNKAGITFSNYKKTYQAL